MCSSGGDEIEMYNADDILREARQLYARLPPLSIVSNIAFSMSGFLTDIMLVSNVIFFVPQTNWF